MCLEANITSQCDIKFPMTVAFAEHFSNTTFYQTAAAALKNVEQYCSVCKYPENMIKISIQTFKKFGIRI